MWNLIQIKAPDTKQNYFYHYHTQVFNIKTPDHFAEDITVIIVCSEIDIIKKNACLQHFKQQLQANKLTLNYYNSYSLWH
jgi:hypothetical protein